MRRRPVLLLFTLSLAACTPAVAEDPVDGAAAADSASAPIPWPDDYGDGEDGLWRAELTRDQIVQRANQYADTATAACVTRFLEAIPMRETMTWELSMRDGTWVLYGDSDLTESLGRFDGGTYMLPHIEGQPALFASAGPGSHIDYWLYPRFEGDSLTFNLIDLTQLTGAGTEPTCFEHAGVIVEFTNTFTRVD